MKQSRDKEAVLNEKSDLSLQEFCNMNQLYRLLENWSKGCGMAVMIVDTGGA